MGTDPDRSDRAGGQDPDWFGALGGLRREEQIDRPAGLDWSLIVGRRQLDRTLRTYAEHHNRARPHRALALATPLAEAGTRCLSALAMFAGGTCWAGSSTSTTAWLRERIGILDPPRPSAGGVAEQGSGRPVAGRP